VSSECGLSDLEVWSECRRSGPRVGQVWKFQRNDDETVKPTSLVALEELFVRVFRCAAPLFIWGIFSAC